GGNVVTPDVGGAEGLERRLGVVGVAAGDIDGGAVGLHAHVRLRNRHWGEDCPGIGRRIVFFRGGCRLIRGRGNVVPAEKINLAVHGDRPRFGQCLRGGGPGAPDQRGSGRWGRRGSRSG